MGMLARAKRAEFFAPSMLKEIDVDPRKQMAVLTLGGHMHEEHSHYEAVGQGRGCFMVNGYSESNDPTALFVEYRKSGEAWLIGGLRLYCQEKTEFPGFFDKALGPDEAQAEIMCQFEERTKASSK
jgi:hypothetical protein